MTSIYHRDGFWWDSHAGQLQHGVRDVGADVASAVRLGGHKDAVLAEICRLRVNRPYVANTQHVMAAVEWVQLLSGIAAGRLANPAGWSCVRDSQAVLWSGHASRLHSLLQQQA